MAVGAVRESFEDERRWGADIVCRTNDENTESASRECESRRIMSRYWRVGAYASLRQRGTCESPVKKWWGGTYG